MSEELKEPMTEETAPPAAEETVEVAEEAEVAEVAVEEQPDELQLAQQEIAELKDRVLRAAAEFDNYRKRTEKEKRQSVALGMIGALEKILPVLDTLEIAAAAESKDADYKKGVEMTVSLFKTALGSLGVEEIEALGQPFDPNLHAAVAREASEEAQSGTVLRVLQKGYKTADRVVRHAMVSVAE